MSTQGPISGNVKKEKRKRVARAPPGFFGTLVRALHPQACLRACHGNDCFEHEPITDDLITSILADWREDDEKVRAFALEDLRHLVDDDHAYNR